jgi:hypothetical protein
MKEEKSLKDALTELYVFCLGKAATYENLEAEMIEAKVRLLKSYLDDVGCVQAFWGTDAVSQIDKDTLVLRNLEEKYLISKGLLMPEYI